MAPPARCRITEPAGQRRRSHPRHAAARDCDVPLNPTPPSGRRLRVGSFDEVVRTPSAERVQPPHWTASPSHTPLRPAPSHPLLDAVVDAVVDEVRGQPLVCGRAGVASRRGRRSRNGAAIGARRHRAAPCRAVGRLRRCGTGRPGHRADVLGLDGRDLDGSSRPRAGLEDLDEAVAAGSDRADGSTL